MVTRAAAAVPHLQLQASAQAGGPRGLTEADVAREPAHRPWVCLPRDWLLRPTAWPRVHASISISSLGSDAHVMHMMLIGSSSRGAAAGRRRLLTGQRDPEENRATFNS